MRTYREQLVNEYKAIEKSRSEQSRLRREEIDREIPLIDELAKKYDLDINSKSKGKDTILERTKNQIQAIKDAQKAYEEYLNYFSREDAFKNGRAAE